MQEQKNDLLMVDVRRTTTHNKIKIMSHNPSDKMMFKSMEWLNL